jgi:hypothetical protein
MLLTGPNERSHVCLSDVAEKELRVDEVVARVQVAVVFEGNT